MLESLVAGFLILADPFHMGMLMLGVLLGMVVGIIPGIGGTAGLAITLPFIFGVDPSAALALLIGLISVTATSDTITCVLLSIPGTAGSVATIVDGHPMARQGEAARALSAAFVSSATGGLFGAVILALSIPIVKPLVKLFGSPEFLMLTLLGIAAVSMLTGRNPLKGFASAVIGLMLAAVGGAPLISCFRYSFGSPYLYEGIPLVLVALGVFGVPEMVDLMVKGLPIAGMLGVGKGTLTGIKDALKNKWLILRCSAIGCYVGFVPGMGSSVGNWLGYAHAIQSSKDKSQFGRGDVRGVIGPESANNASRGGELIPTLMFGVPGSTPMALMLLAFIMFGIYPGPDMLTKHLDLVFAIVWSLVIGNVVGALLCLFLVRYLAKIATVRIHILAPLVIIIIIMGALQATQNWGDLIALLALGILGWIMKQTGFGRPPLIVGFVLGKLAERYLGISVAWYGATWLYRPWVIVIGIGVIATIFLGIRMQRSKDEVAST